MTAYPDNPSTRAIFVLWELTNNFDDGRSIIPLDFYKSGWKEYNTPDGRSGLQILDPSSKRCISVERTPENINFTQYRNTVLERKEVSNCSSEPVVIGHMDSNSIEFVLIDHTEEYTQSLLEKYTLCQGDEA